jgi:TPP-dependent pyruvate/acetoin dehydrogenase alpha subunit
MKWLIGAIALALPASAAADEPGPPPPPVRPLSAMIVAGGAAAIALGALFIIEAGNTEDALRGGAGSIAELEDRRDAERAMGTTLFVAGGLAAAAGAAMIVRDLTRDRAPPVAVAPIPGGAVVSGTLAF